MFVPTPSSAPWLAPALACLAAYVLGSIPTGLWVTRARGIDIRAVGSGNIGATNVARALGRRWAIFVLICDAIKGFVPVFLCAHWVARTYAYSYAYAYAYATHTPTHWFAAITSPTLVALVGLCAIVGHMFTFFLRGQGGKGVATSLGVAFGLSPSIALASLAIYATTYAATRLSSLGSLLGMWAFPAIALGLTTLPTPYVALSLACAVLVTWRHRTNIGRLLRGQEGKT